MRRVQKVLNQGHLVRYRERVCSVEALKAKLQECEEANWGMFFRRGQVMPFS